MSMEPDKWKIVKAKAGTSKRFYTPKKALDKTGLCFVVAGDQLFFKYVCSIYDNMCH